jgi:aminoglycoside phosphotransferase (APT) family kinase protein
MTAAGTGELDVPEAVVRRLLVEQAPSVCELPLLAPTLKLPVPAPVVIGRPSTQFPWPWSVAPWYDGDVAAVTPPTRIQAPIMGRFLTSLHRPAPEAAPRSDSRGVPLALRQPSITAWTQHPWTSGDEGLIAAAVKVFEAGLATVLATDRVWLHGDLHPRNIWYATVPWPPSSTGAT